MPIDDLTLMDDPSGGGAMPPFDDPAYAEGEADALATQAGEGAFDHQTLIDNIGHRNIAETLDEDELSKIGQKVLREYELDLGTRSDWEARSRAAMDLAMQIAKAKSHPWPNASNVVYPLMTTAAVQFAARAYPAIVMGRNVVKGVVVGKDDGVPMIDPRTRQPVMSAGPGGQPQPAWIVQPGAKKERAARIGEHMSWQLLQEMTEWEEETDKLLHILPIIGCAFRKSFFDPAVGHNASMLVLAENLVINYFAKSMERAPRLTERLQYYPYEIEEQVRAGLFLDHAYGTAENANGDEDAPHEFLEQHRWLDLDDDGYPEPYIVTVHKQTGKVARIVARYDAEGVKISQETGAVVQIDPVHYYTKYDFLPNPDGGIYGVGYGQLLGPINESVNTTLNMLFDAGNLQNAGGGFIGRGPSMHSGSLKFKLGEWKPINVPGQTMRDAIVPFNHPGPSAQLIALLSFLVEAGKEVASVKDVLAGDSNPNIQPTTLLAMIEQGLKVFTAIFKRVYRSLDKELDKLYRLNRIYLENQSEYQVGDETRMVSKDDYMQGPGVEPVADPSMATDMQKMARAQLVDQYKDDPNINRLAAIKRVFDAAGIERPEELINEETPPNPLILAQTADLERKDKEADSKIATDKATQIEKISAAVLNLAKADEANAAAPLEQTAQYIKLLELQLQSLLAPAGGKARGQPVEQEGMPAPQSPEPGFDPMAMDPGMDPARAAYGYQQ